MKILFLTNHLNQNDGWSRYTFDIGTELIKHGHQVYCLVCQPSTQTGIVERVVLDDPLRYLGNIFRVYTTARQIQHYVDEFDPDIIHVPVEPYVFLLSFLKIRRAVTVLTVHGTYSYIPVLFKNPLRKIMASYLTMSVYQRLNKIIAGSHYTEKYLLTRLSSWLRSAIKNKIFVISHGIHFKENLSLVRQSNPSSRKNILFVGGIKARKGILEAIEALKIYKERYGDMFLFRIVGSFKPNDVYYQTVRSAVSRAALDKNVVFEGRVDDVRLDECYKQADVFLMLSINDGKHFEGFGLVYLEANMYGVPCIGPNDSGAAEAILDGTTGYVVNAHNSEQVADRLNNILNKNLIEKKQCVAWAQKNDLSYKIRELLDIYTKNV